MHVHSTFSDGRSTVSENLEAAIMRGLDRLGSVEHVRRDTEWLPAYVDEVSRIKRAFNGKIDLSAGVEAKILNEHGELDLPDDLEGVDYILAADHQFPLGDTCLTPAAVVDLVRKQTVSATRLIAALTRSYCAMMSRYRSRNVILAHPFSILPKIGLDEYDIPELWLQILGTRAALTGTLVEISERWKCPSVRSAAIFRECGVEIRFSTDAHTATDVGRYEYVAEVACKISGIGPWPEKSFAV